MPRLFLLIFLGFAGWSGAAAADQGRAVVAAAANFATPLKALTARFEADTGHQITVATGSTGQMYAQIRAGAPYDLFLAADQARPAALIAEGAARPVDLFTYAQGHLVLWSATPGVLDNGPERALRDPALRHVALANPDLAPYGAAAAEVLDVLGLMDSVAEKLVRGQSVGQVYAMVATGNAGLGFVAASYLTSGSQDGSRWVVPGHLHAPILQDAVLLSPGVPAAAQFAAFLRGPVAREIIEGFGYSVPEAQG